MSRPKALSNDVQKNLERRWPRSPPSRKSVELAPIRRRCAPRTPQMLSRRLHPVRPRSWSRLPLPKRAGMLRRRSRSEVRQWRPSARRASLILRAVLQTGPGCSARAVQPTASAISGETRHHLGLPARMTVEFRAMGVAMWDVGRRLQRIADLIRAAANAGARQRGAREGCLITAGGLDNSVHRIVKLSRSFAGQPAERGGEGCCGDGHRRIDIQDSDLVWPIGSPVSVASAASAVGPLGRQT